MSQRVPATHFTSQLARFITWGRWPILIALGCITLASAWFALGIRFEFSPQSLYAGSGEVLDYAEAFREDFRYDDGLLLVILESRGTNDALHTEALTWQVEVARKFARVSGIVRVSTISTMHLPRPRLLPPFFGSSRVVRHLPVTDEDEQRLRATLERYRLFDQTMISRDRRVVMLILTLDSQARDVVSMTEVTRSVKRILGDQPPPKGYRAFVTGLPALRVQIIQDLKREQLTQLPLVALLFVLLLFFIFRTVSGTLLPLLAVGLALSWTVGLMACLGWSFNLISNVLPVLLLIIGVSNSVHVYSRFLEEYDRRSDVQVALRATLSHMSWACLLTTATTAIGFLSLCAANSDPLQEFGMEAALGMLLLYLSIIFGLGALLSLFARPAQHGISQRHSWLGRASTAAGMFGVRWRLLFGLGSLGLIALCLWSASGVTINSRMIETYGRRHPVRAGIDLIEKRLSGFTALEVSLTADRPDRLFEPETYRKVAEFERFAHQCEQVILVRSYVDLFQEMYRNLRRSDPDAGQLPSSNDTGRRRIAWSRAMAHRMAGPMEYHSFMRPDESRARILCCVKDAGSRATLQLIGRLQKELDRLFPQSSGITAEITGEAFLFSTLLDDFIRSIFYSLCGASLLIFAMIAALFRSPRIGLIAAGPNLTPLIVTLGYMGWRGYDLTAGNVIVFAVSIGIAVDNTIHFLARFQEESPKHGSIFEALQSTLQNTGRAIVLTTAIIVLGLSAMFTSEFVPTRRFAELTSVTMLAALVGDLILLPICVALFWKRPRTGDEMSPAIQ